jgi:hypothetical protein
MRTLAVVAVIIAVAMVILGLILEALGWLIAIGLVVLVVALIAGWIGLRRVTSGRHDGPT